MPKASIIIPSYNAAAYIGETISSILAQSCDDFECIVIDDGSTDNTVEVVKSYDDSRIKIIEQENSGGPAKPRNIGMRNASGEYIFIFDSDDLMRPNKLQVSIDALRANPLADFLFTNFSAIDEHGAVINRDFLCEYNTLWSLFGGRPDNDRPILISANKLCGALMRANFIGTSSVVIRAAALDGKHSFNEDLLNGDDYLFWMRFLKNHNALFVDSVLHDYRVRKDSISNRSYLRRGPSRIKVLEILKEECEFIDHHAVISNKLSREYVNMANAYRNSGDYKNQKDFALKSMQLKFSMRAMKLLFSSYLFRNFH